MKKLLSHFLVIIVAITMISCSGSKPVEKYIPILVPVSDADKSVTKNGVTVEVGIINESNTSLYPDLYTKFVIMRSTFAGPLESEAYVRNALGDFSEPAAVTFSIKITNNTGHIVKFSGSDVGISVSGKDHRKLDATKIISAYGNYFNKNYPDQRSVPQELLTVIQNAPLWDENQKVLPGKSITVYAPFDVNLKKGFSTATLSIYDLVTNVDNAGNPTERTNLDFNFKESNFMLK